MVQRFADDEPSFSHYSIGNYQMVALVSISVFVSFRLDSLTKEFLACEEKLFVELLIVAYPRLANYQ